MEYPAAVAEGWEQFGRRVYAQSQWEGIGGADEVVVIGDGARWVWELAEEHFPGAVQILDFCHASGHLWEAAWVIGSVSFVQDFRCVSARPRLSQWSSGRGLRYLSPTYLSPTGAVGKFRQLALAEFSIRPAPLRAARWRASRTLSG